MTSVSSPPEVLSGLPDFARTDASGPRRRTHRGSFLCHAVIATELRAGRTRIARLRADTPLSPRPTIASGVEPYVRGGDAARIRMSTSAAGPVGGDTYLLDIHVREGSTLRDPRRGAPRSCFRGRTARGPVGSPGCASTRAPPAYGSPNR